ncbi:MAG: 2TM domain-containing protein [Dehalococcoidia bacterium]|nr:MAG: 2TM domain-containing protein [Dehalococcoidia bacterium]
MDEKEAYRRAEKLVTQKIGFLRHLMIYVVVNILLLAINMVISSGFYWFLLVLGIWGIVLLSHFIGIFILKGDRFERWRMREIEKEAEKLRKLD